jgi:hypothetical protein
MVWGPFFIALVFGLLVSAALYFVLLWPGREPPEDPDANPDADPDAHLDAHPDAGNRIA